MSIIESLSPIKKKFFESIGICNDDDIPSSFNEKILHLDSVISESEKFCIGDYHICYQSKDLFPIKDLVGTDHDRYAGKTWLEAFIDLDRGDENLELYFKNPNYYENLILKGKSDLGLVKKNGNYYIYGKAGGGNNRLIIMKLKYLAIVNKNNLDLLALDKEFSFLGNIRYIPTKTTVDNIFNLVYPDGGYNSSEYYVINKSNSENMELYDIVVDYPINTQIIASNVLGENINKIELQSSYRRTK